MQDIAAVIEGLKEVGYEGALSVEIGGLDPTKMARDSYTNLKRLLFELFRETFQVASSILRELNSYGFSVPCNSKAMFL